MTQSPSGPAGQAQTAPDAAGAPASPSANARIAQKVELDLDDAPFLQDEPPPPKATEEQPAEAAGTPQVTAAAPAPPSLKERLLANKKRLIIAAASFVGLLAVGIGVNVFLSGAPKPPPPAEPRKVVVPDAPKPLPAAPAPQYVMRWDPFWVEQKDSEGATRFLVCRFSIPTDSASLYAEMQQKRIILRDAFYYYLRNLPITPLSNEAAMRKLKQELMTVVNEHVGSGKVEDLYIEEYLLK